LLKHRFLKYGVEVILNSKKWADNLVFWIQKSLLMSAVAWIAFFPLKIHSQELQAKMPLSELVFTQHGELPIILSAPHGGTRPIPDVPERKGDGLEKGGAGFFAGRDAGTEELAYAVSDAIEKQYGKQPYMVVSQSHRKYLDPNRPPDIAYEDEEAMPVYNYYHESMANYCQEASNKFHAVLLLDLHGQGSKADTVFRGTRNGSTVKHLRRTFGEEAFTGEKSLFAMLARQGWTVHPLPQTGKEQAGYTGGHIVGTYGSSNGSVVDAYQLEFGAEYRLKSKRTKTAEELANAIVDYADAYLKLPRPAKKPAAKTP
jgi:N-formylglutamate amidohydrolase